MARIPYDSKIAMWFSIGLVGGERSEKVEISSMGLSREEWDNMTDSEQTDFLNEYFEEWQASYIEGSWDIAEYD